MAPPEVSIPTDAGAFDTAGYVNVEHAQHYARVQAQLDLLQQQGMIAGYVAQPAAYTFAVSGANSEAVAQLALLGQLQPTGELSTASVGALAGSYQQQLTAEIAAATRLRTQAVPYPAPLSPPPDLENLQAPAVAAIGEIGAAALVAPEFTVQLHSNSVYGTVAQGTVVTATLKSAAGIAKGTDIAFASFGDMVYLSLKDTFDNPVLAVPGDIVEVQAPNLITIPVVDLRVTPDPASGQIMGIAPANVTSTDPASPPTLSLDLAPSYFLTTTASGTFAISSPWVERGRQWQMRFTNAQGHQVVLNGMVPILVLRGWFSNSQGQYQGDSNVSGAVVAANAVVTVTLTHPGNSAVVNFARSASQGTFDLHLSDLYGNPVNIQAGDTIQATDGIVTLTSIAPAFAVTSDPEANRLSGTTNATVVTDTLGLPGTLALWPTDLGDYLYGKPVLAPGGSFVAENPFDWSANPIGPPVTLDWNPGQQGHLRYVDAAGNVVYANFAAPTLDPVLQLRGDGYSYSNNTVYGSVGYCGYGTLALVDAAGAVKDQNSVYACNGFASGFLDVYGNPLPISDGDSVVATFNGRTTTTKAPSLSLAADAKTDIVSGQITAGLVTTTTYGAPQSLAVFADMYSYANSKMVAPDGAGNFVVDFSGTANIYPGASGLAMYVDAKGNKVYAKWDAPVDKPKLSFRGGDFYYYYYGSGYQADNYVFVGLPQSNCSLGVLDLVVKAQDGATRWQDTIYVGCSSNTALYLTDDFGNDINLDAGDVVEATFGGQTASVTVPSFEVLSDPKANTVAGVTNAAVTTTTVGLTQTLSVWPDSLWDGDRGKYVQVAGTAFSATDPFYAGADPLNWPVSLDWNAGDEGHLRYIDAAGNNVYASFAALVEQPKLGIQKGGNWVGGMVPAGNAPVTITVTSGATVKGVGYDTSSLAGRFDINLYDGSGNPLNIAEGDQVVLAQPETTVMVPPLSVNIDIDQDLVRGSGPASSLLNVKQPESPLQAPRSVTTGGDGSYMADFRGIADLAPGVLVQVEYENTAGHSIWVERYAGTMLAAALNTNRVWGYTPDERTPVVVTVKRAGSVIGTDSFTFMGSGHFTAFPVDATGKPIVLVAGDVIELDLGAGVVKTLTLASLAMTIDNQANLLSGVGPSASLLGVTAAAQPAEYDDSVLTNATGQWTVDLAAKAKDIEPGAVASVRYSANGIDTTWLFGVSSYFLLRDGGNNVVKGYAAPYTPVTITLLRNGGVLAVTHEEAADSGWYWSDLYDVNGLQVDIKAGDIVEVKSAQAMSVTVPILQASVDNAARTVRGIGPPNATIGVFTSNWIYYGGKTVKTDANGAFSASLAQDYAGGQVWLRYREPQGNWIYAYSTQQSGAPVYLYARWNTATGEYLAHAVSGSAGGGPRQVLLTLRNAASR